MAARIQGKYSISFSFVFNNGIIIKRLVAQLFGVSRDVFLRRGARGAEELLDRALCGSYR